MSTTLDLSEINQKIGPLFMAGMPGAFLDKETAALIREYHLGGIILFARNVENPVQVATLCRDLQKCARTSYGLPLFLAVDQEGGSVARLKEPFTLFPGNRSIGLDLHPEKKAREFGRVTAREMKLVGLNMDLAPVVDVPKGEPEKHLRNRTFGEDPGRVAHLGRIVIRSLQKGRIMAVAKHFPGLGRADLDPHFHLPRIHSDAEEIEAVNLLPFRAAIEEGVSGVMTSHALYTALDPDRPGSLSSFVLTTFLRKKMGYDGLIITDDLEMGAIAESWGVAGGAAAAFEAGADILLICKDQERVRESFELIRGKFLRGEISCQRLEDSNRRILKAKMEFLTPITKISLTKVKRYFKA